jgi:epoxyqueuosine reductase
MHQLAAEIKQHARSLGFDLVGVAPAEVSKYRAYFAEWLANGSAGEMGYLHRRFDERTDPATYCPGARSIICVAMNYHVPLDPPAEQETGRIARYALGDDYHELIKDRLHALADWIRQRCPDAQTRAAVDTAPVMEKEISARAGVGWVGKNTCIIHPQVGSWLLLGEVITTLDLPADEPAVDRCGTCRRCIDACPTGAITPYSVDARRCISYQTLENRGEVPASLHAAMQDAGFVVGCDICQEVCPFNRDGRPLPTQEPEFAPRAPAPGVGLASILRWNEQEWDILTRGRASRRAKFDMWRRNAEILQGPPLPQPDAARQHGADA